MDWFLYDKGLRRESVKIILFQRNNFLVSTHKRAVFSKISGLFNFLALDNSNILKIIFKT